jgi:CO/xanthine dehydrogenase FAD-binding subunit
MIRPFQYHCPKTVPEVSALLAAHPQAALLAGGTDLLVDMRGGALRPAVVIDLKRVAGLDELRPGGERGPGFVGACVTLNRVVEDGALPSFVREAAASVGTYQVRNRATLAGNLCHASPAADTAPPLLVLGASVRVCGADGSETTRPLAGFFTGVKRTVLGPGEWVLGIELPAQDAAPQGRFLKRQRVKGHDLAVVNAAACVWPGRRRLRLAVGACAPTPLVFELGDLLPAGGGQGGAWLDAAWARVAAALRPISDNRGSAEYRTDMAQLFVRTMLEELGPLAG